MTVKRPKARTTAPPALVPDPPVDDLPLDEPADELDDIDLLLTNHRGYVRVNRVMPGGRIGFLRRFDRADLSKDPEKTIGDTWGGGLYRLEVFDQTEQGPRWAKARFRDLALDESEYGPPKGAYAPAETIEFPDDDPSPGVDPRGAYQPPRSPASTALEIEKLRLEASREDRREMMGMFKEMAQALRPAQAMGLDDVLRVADQMITARGPAAGAAAPAGGDPRVNKILDIVVERAIENLGSGGGAGGEAPSFLERLATAAVEKGLPTLMALATAQASARGQRAPATPPPKLITPAARPHVPDEPVAAAPAEPAAAVDVPAVNGAHAMPETAQHNMVEAIKMNPYVAVLSDMLIQDAMKNVDPQETADRVLAIVGDDDTRNAMLDQLVVDKTTPELVEYLAVFDPRFREHAEWVARLQVLLQPEPEDAAPAEPVAVVATPAPVADALPIVAAPGKEGSVVS